MPLYRYQSPSPIQEARFIRNEAGGYRAYLGAAENASPDALRETIHNLKYAGYVIVPCRVDGRDMLEVRGFKNPDKLRAALGEMGAVTGRAAKDSLAEDKVSAAQWLKRNALVAISVAYLGSDVMYMKYEDVNSKFIKERKKEKFHNEINDQIIKYNNDNPEDQRPRLISAKEEDLKNHAKTFNEDKNNPKYTLEKETKRTGWERFWDTLAGKGYLAGSSASLLSLILRGDTTSAELSYVSRIVAEAATKEGIAPAEDSSIVKATTFKDLRNSVVRWFSKHASDWMNGAFAIAGVAIAKDSYEKLSELKKLEQDYAYLNNADLWKGRHAAEKSVALKDTILGVGTFLSGASSIVIKERKHDPNKPKKKGIAGVIEHMKENPLSIAGAGYILSTLIHLVSSVQERASINKENRELKAKDPNAEPFPTHHTFYRLGFVIINLLAEATMFFTSKGHGEGVRSDASIDDTAAAMAAELIAQKPEAEQADLLARMAKNLSKADGIAKPVAEVEKMIRDQLEAYKQSPWAQAMSDSPPALNTTFSNQELEQQVNEQHPQEGIAKGKHERLDVSKWLNRSGKENGTERKTPEKAANFIEGFSVKSPGHMSSLLN